MRWYSNTGYFDVGWYSVNSPAHFHIDHSQNVTVGGNLTSNGTVTASGNISSSAGSVSGVGLSSSGGLTLSGTTGITISDTKAAGNCAVLSGNSCTATVRSNCHPVCGIANNGVSTGVNCEVASGTLTAHFNVSGTNSVNFICF